MPVRAVGLTTAITMLLLLIPIGSTTAFNAFISLATVGLYFSYTVPCLFAFLQRLNKEEVAHSPYSMGRWGIWLNGAGFVYGTFVLIFACFPPVLPVTAVNMNYSGSIMGFVMLVALVDWALRGRYKFKVPLGKTEID